MAILEELAPDVDMSAGPVGLRLATEALLDAAGPVPMPDGVTVRTIPATDDVPELRVYEPSVRVLTDAAVLYIHGGGLVAGRPDMDDPFCPLMVLDLGCPVVSVRYTLAPEGAYPIASDEVLAALRFVASDLSGLDVAPGRIVVEGSSAGGGLAAGLALRARDEFRADAIAGLVLHYPMLDDRPRRASMERVTAAKIWHADANRQCWDAAVGTLDEVPATAAPSRATIEQLRGLPPTHLDVGILDGFLDEDIEFARDLADAGVEVDLTVTARAFHASERLDPRAPSSRRILAARTNARRRYLGLEPHS